MAKKLAVTISGAVSLGSYEAGVLYEVIRTIQHHNEKERNNPDQQIKIDILTGASAGGMTATIAAQKLLFEAASLQEPYNNSLYRAWVKDVNFESLLNLHSEEDPGHSILSSNHVEDISRKHLTDRYASPIPPAKDQHLAAADTIHLGLALSNLNGVDYMRPLRPTNEKFCYTLYHDKMTRRFGADDDKLDAWEIVRNAAVSCGAFPLAFRTKELVRHHDEVDYASLFLPFVPEGSFRTAIRKFLYTDGGTFENEPLGMAKQLVDQLEDGHVNHDQRFYLFVAPSARTGTSQSELNEKQNGNFVGAIEAIVKAIFNQARFRDWIKAEKINDQIQILDERAKQLKAGFLDGTIQASQLQTATDCLLPQLLGAEIIDAERLRIRMQYREGYNQIAEVIDDATADIWRDAVLLLESAAALGDKDQMIIYGITASDAELAGGALFAFLGFFDQAYRDHDYDVGRTKAREFIKNVHANPDVDLWFPHHPDNDPAQPREDWMNIRPIDVKLNGLKLTDVDESIRRRFKERLVDRADKLLVDSAESGVQVPWVVREGILNFFVKPKLNKWLGLS